MKFNQLGRSMVEMLGVLAIIGVLSVGAISGYSKAMMKYKLNKMSAQYRQIIASMVEYVGKITPSGKYSDITGTYIKLNLIPTEMIKNDNSYVYDIFGNKVQITSESVGDTLYCLLKIDNSDQSLTVCRQFFTIVKEFHEDIYVVSSLSNYGNEDEAISNVYGDKYCTNNSKCLVDLTISEINGLCAEHINKDDSHLKLRIK